MAVNLSVEEYVQRINKAGKTSVLGFIEQGRECADANEKLSPEEKKELHSKLNIDKRTFSFCVAIGNCEFLETYASFLPPALYTLQYLTKVKEQELKTGIADGIVHPNATRSAMARTFMSPSAGRAPRTGR